MKLKTAFAGFAHPHVLELVACAQNCPGAEVIGAWEGSPSPERRAAAEKAGVSFNFSTYDELLASDADIVVICDKYGKRGSLAAAALRAGKNVLCDKPLCTSRTELDEIETLAETKNLRVGCMFSLRYEPNVRTLKRIVASGRLGEIHNVIFTGCHPLLYGKRPEWYFEAGMHGGTINDIAVHGVDVIRFAMGREVARTLAARCFNAYAVNEPDFADSADFMLELDNGAGVVADVSYASPDSFGYAAPTYWQFTVFGSGGMVRFNLTGAVEGYFNGEMSPELIKPDAPIKENCFSDLVAEISGQTDGTLTTRDVFASSRQTLEIQQAADTRKK